MKAHLLKTWPAYFQAVIEGSKPFEVRRDDGRMFSVGDVLALMEFDPHDGDEGSFTGRCHAVQVTYILKGGQHGIEEGYSVLGIEQV